MNQLEETKRVFLGYKIEKRPVNYEGFLKECFEFVSDEPIPNLEREYNSFDEVKAKARDFYEKHFKIHQVYTTEIEDPSKLNTAATMNLTKEEYAKTYYEFVKKCKLISPFDLPVNFQKEEKIDMGGHVSKIVFVIPPKVLPPFVTRVVPFANIILRGMLDDALAATYIHELMHTQIESRIGYAEDFCLKETLPVFIEKVYALENDPTGTLLQRVNKVRTKYDITCLGVPFVTGKISENDVYHATGGIVGLALFDKYLNEQSEDLKQEYFDDIQKVMDGKMKVDALLEKRGINAKMAFKSELIKKYA